MTDSFLDTKADRQRIRHASFVSRITKPSSQTPSRSRSSHTSSSTSSSSAPPSAAARKNARRHANANSRRHAAGPAPLASAGAMDALAAALPSLTADEVSAGAAARDGRVRHRSLRSKPGALKRRERVVRGEMERFGLSLAQLAGVREEEGQQQKEERGDDDADTAMAGDVVAATTQPQQQQPSAVANRFAALRGYISATLEQNPAFAQRPPAPAAAAAAAGAKGA